MAGKGQFRTDSLALCPFLAMNDLNYAGTELDRHGKTIFVFDDPSGIGSNLAIDFVKSKERTYKNLWNFFRNELSKKLRPQTEYYERLEK